MKRSLRHSLIKLSNNTFDWSALTSRLVELNLPRNVKIFHAYKLLVQAAEGWLNLSVTSTLSCPRLLCLCFGKMSKVHLKFIWQLNRSIIFHHSSNNSQRKTICCFTTDKSPQLCVFEILLYFDPHTYHLSLSQVKKEGEGKTLILQVSQRDSGVYLCEAQTKRGSQKSEPVSLEVGSTTGKPQQE